MVSRVSAYLLREIVSPSPTRVPFGQKSIAHAGSTHRKLGTCAEELAERMYLTLHVVLVQDEDRCHTLDQSEAFFGVFGDAYKSAVTFQP